jgi:hypothetical protein
MRRTFAVSGVILSCATLIGCDASKAQTTGANARGGGSLAACDPLAPGPVTLGTILAIGSDPQSTLYLADEVPDGGQNRVFVSAGTTLYRQHVAGSGGGGGGSAPDADYTFSFAAPFADAATGHALLIQKRGGAVTAVALGAFDSRAFYAPDAGDELLAIVDAGAIDGFATQDLPALVEHVADVNDGDSIVVTQPMDPWGYSGFRLFYGTPANMIERPITLYNRGDTDDFVSFTVDGAVYTADFTFQAFGLVDASRPPAGPESLTLGDGGTLPMTERMPVPTSLSGFSFACIE